MFQRIPEAQAAGGEYRTLTDRYGMFTRSRSSAVSGRRSGMLCGASCSAPSKARPLPRCGSTGVEHEFSPIPGVVEDATDIILNLKQIPFKMADEGMKTVNLRVDQACEVTSGMIESGPDVDVLDRNLHIATVSRRPAAWPSKCA